MENLINRILKNSVRRNKSPTATKASGLLVASEELIARTVSCFMGNPIVGEGKDWEAPRCLLVCRTETRVLDGAKESTIVEVATNAKRRASSFTVIVVCRVSCVSFILDQNNVSTNMHEHT